MRKKTELLTQYQKSKAMRQHNLSTVMGYILLIFGLYGSFAIIRLDIIDVKFVPQNLPILYGLVIIAAAYLIKDNKQE